MMHGPINIRYSKVLSMPVPHNWTGAFLTVSTPSSSRNPNSFHLNKHHSWYPTEPCKPTTVFLEYIAIFLLLTWATNIYKYGSYLMD